MADIIVNMGGIETNIGDPTNSDPIYLDGSRQLCTDAQGELSSFGRLGLVDYQKRGGPKTQAYLAEIQRLAASKIIYGHWPVLPDSIED